jgi:hypothetical protein
MKKVLTIIVLLLFVITLTARNTDRVKFPGGKCYMLRVQLCDIKERLSVLTTPRISSRSEP